MVPWETDPTAQVICDIVGADGKDIVYTPRNVLRRVVKAYADKGWKAIVAPEVEFYLVAPNTDPARAVLLDFSAARWNDAMRAARSRVSDRSNAT